MSISKPTSSAQLETEDARKNLAEKAPSSKRKDPSSKGNVQGASAAEKSCVAREFAPSLKNIGQEDGSCCVYVVRLKRGVLNKKKFVEANRDGNSSGQNFSSQNFSSQSFSGLCLYVGHTAHAPSERFRKHKADHWASRWVRDYGTELLPRFYTSLDRMPRKKAKEVEELLAEFLREKGHAVWQN
jgi:hypothetical protein